MKVQVKGEHKYKTQFEVVEESANYYICLNPFQDHTALAKSDFEPVPETWRDVTGECELSRFSRITHQGNYVDGHIDGKPLDGYRLRKVHTFEDWDGRARGSNEPVWAFIVERKDP